MRSDIQSYPLSWHPETGGKLAPIVFRDDITKSLGDDPTGRRFQKIKSKILSGNYYPSDAVQFTPTETPLKPGTRIFQRAPMIPGLPWPCATSITEIFIAEETPNSFHIGYVTTSRHHGRGIWQAKITHHKNCELEIRVWSTAMPNSFLFWLGLPWARYLQLRARRRAIEEFQKI